jgi:hypothetical protein
LGGCITFKVPDKYGSWAEHGNEEKILWTLRARENRKFKQTSLLRQHYPDLNPGAGPLNTEIDFTHLKKEQDFSFRCLLTLGTARTAPAPA